MSDDQKIVIRELFVPLTAGEWSRAKWAARRSRKADGRQASLAEWAAEKIRAQLPPDTRPTGERAPTPFPGTTPEQTAPAAPADQQKD